VSSHKQEDGASLEVQLESCRRYCENTGLVVVAEFREVQSGLDVDRPQYQAALRLAKAKAIDKLVVYRYDRSGRDDAEYMGMLKDFAKLGIMLVSASGESPDPLYQKLAGVLAWDESRRLSIRVTGSKVMRHAEGKWGGKPPFGYTTEKLVEGGSKLAPRDGEAELVTEMFTRYASGKASLSDLRDYLNGAGVLRSRYAVWYILTNRVYTGMVPRGRYVDSQFHETPEQVTWTIGKHSALVDPETFDKVQERLAENKHRQRGGTAPRYLFSGLVICGTCGRKYVGRHTNHGRGGKEWNWYACNRRTGFGDCESHTVYESRIRELVIPPIEQLLAQLQQEDLRVAIREELMRQQEDQRGEGQLKKLGLRNQLERLETRLSNLEDEYLDRTISKERYMVRRDEFLGEMAGVNAALAHQPKAHHVDIDQLCALADSITLNDLDAEAWRDIVEAMVDKVIITGAGGGKRGQAVVTVFWKPEYGSLVASLVGDRDA
jgi:DNA invertase Pin-like site-specific DNA recombinase